MIKIVSFANKNSSGLVNFKNSVRRYKGWELEIVGMGMKWEGWITRMETYRKIAQNERDPERLLVFIDGFDVICLRDSHGFLEHFHSTRKKFVFGSETTCLEWINCHKPKNWQKKNQIWGDYVNGGCVISKAKDAAFLWGWCIEQGHTRDDQVALAHFMDRYPEDVMLDTDSTFVHNDNFGTRTPITIVDNKLSIQDSSKNPYFIHFPGLQFYASNPLRMDAGITPKNYLTVIQLVLKDEAITEIAVHRPSILIFRTIFYVILALFFLFLVAFLCLLIFRLISKN